MIKHVLCCLYVQIEGTCIPVSFTFLFYFLYFLKSICEPRLLQTDSDQTTCMEMCDDMLFNSGLNSWSAEMVTHGDNVKPRMWRVFFQSSQKPKCKNM